MLETPPDYDFVLHPHRSLGMKGFFLVMGLIGGFSFIAGIVFILQGAWPVMGFLGLDVFLIYVAFRMSYRTGPIRERVVISGGNVTVVRRDARGREQFWEFPAYWARADMETDRRGFGKLYVGSHDRRVRIGAFLTPEELSEFRWTLEDALQLSRATAAPGRG